MSSNSDSRSNSKLKANPEKPNIIFLFSDQQRHDTCGCYGQALNVTPNIDEMAKKGVIFKNAFSCQPVCGPARACIQTGRYATEIDCYRNGLELPISNENIANYFSESGYTVGYIGKWHLAGNYLHPKGRLRKNVSFNHKGVPLERRGGYKDYWLASDVLEFTSHGYDGYYFDSEMNRVDFKGYRADCQTDFVLDYLDSFKDIDKDIDKDADKDVGIDADRNKNKKPFFLFISYLEPHHQNDHHRYEGPDGSKEKFKNFKVPGDLEGTNGDWRENYPDYLGCCHSLDKNLKRIQDKVKELGIDDNTIIFYTSDHGSHFKTRNGEYKRSCHESSIHIPLVIKGPGFEGGKIESELISLIDIPPTLLKCAGIDIPKHMKGRPIQDLIDGSAKDWQQEVFVQISETQIGRAIRTKKWKYSVRAPIKTGYIFGFLCGSSKIYMEEYLYDLENDIHERNNLVSDPKLKEVRAELADILKRKMGEADEKIPKIIPYVSLWKQMLYILHLKK